jgi:arginyl-tRNA synthetase
VLLQSGDATTVALWRQLIELTLQHLDALYAKLDVKLTRADVVGESHFNDDLPTVAAELKAQGLAQVSDGAVCVFPPGFVGREGEPMPLIVQKTDGGFGYGATDLAAIRYRVRQLGAQQLLYVVGTPQHQHLSMVFAVAKMAGWLGDARAEHVAFGSVLGADKKVLKTRAGESVSLESLLDGAVERARALVDAKSPEIGDEERAAIARAVGIGAVKYADLANQRTNDYVFDWNRMLAFDGNTGPYLMYAHARIRSILRKIVEEGLAEPAKDIVLTVATERALGLELLQFPAALATAAEGLYPHRLCQYLYDLATAFSGFYQTAPVLRSEGDTRGSRIALCVLTAEVLSKGLDLVGIQAPMRM